MVFSPRCTRQYMTGFSRHFSPILKEFYKSCAEKGKLEIVYISSDKSINEFNELIQNMIQKNQFNNRFHIQFKKPTIIDKSINMISYFYIKKDLKVSYYIYKFKGFLIGKKF